MNEFIGPQMANLAPPGSSWLLKSSRGYEERQGGARRSQEEPGGARRSEEEPGGARRS
jgi:hypothetical protein